MSRDLKGIYQYSEADDEATFSELLNLGMASVSDAKAYFAGTAAEREALTPAPPGAIWQTTDDDERLYSTSPTGAWRLQEGTATTPAAAWQNVAAPFYGRTTDIDIPTVLGANEYIDATHAGLATGYTVASLVNLVRHPTKTTLTMRLIQFNHASQQAFDINWRIIKRGI